MSKISKEIDRRLDLFNKATFNVKEGEIEPSDIRKHKIYGGAQGIYTNKNITAGLTTDGVGITVSILHTGEHYPDELSDEGLLYHYPETKRTTSRDKNEIQATKNAGKENLPIFIILNGVNSKHRSLKLGWVVGYDDDSKLFNISFSEGKMEEAASDLDDTPFSLTDKSNPGKQLKGKSRPGQKTFKFDVIKRYGQKCAVCKMTNPALLEAIHIKGKAEKGSDDARNGLLMCKNHHWAFDKYLFHINPKSLDIVLASGSDIDDLFITENRISTLKLNTPHQDALLWRWKKAANNIVN